MYLFVEIEKQVKNTMYYKIIKTDNWTSKTFEDTNIDLN